MYHFTPPTKAHRVRVGAADPSEGLGSIPPKYLDANPQTCQKKPGRSKLRELRRSYTMILLGRGFHMAIVVVVAPILARITQKAFAMSINTQGYAIRRNSSCGDEEVKCHKTWENDLAITMACCPHDSHCNDSGQPNTICCPNGLNCTKEIESKPPTCADQRWNMYDKEGAFCCEQDQSGFYIENSIWVGCYLDSSSVNGNYIGLPVLSTGERERAAHYNPCRSIESLTFLGFSLVRLSIHIYRDIIIIIYFVRDCNINNVGSRLNRRLNLHQHGRDCRRDYRRRCRRRPYPRRALLSVAIAENPRSTTSTLPTTPSA